MNPITDPTALDDQIRAATAEAEHTVRRAATAPGITLTHTPAGPWLASRLARLCQATLDGTARACEHLAAGPRVAVVAAWHPTLVVCAPCANTGALLPNETEDRTCDRCRRTVPVIHAHTAALGPLMYVYGLCEPCNRTEHPDTATGPCTRTGRPRRRH